VPGRAADGDVPLSHAQQRLVLAEHLLPGTADNLVAHAYRVTGPVDVDMLVTAVGDTVARHPALRSVLDWDQGGPVQRVLAAADARPHVELEQDSTDGPDEDVAVRVCAPWWDAPFELFRRPPFRYRIVRRSAERHLLCLGFHHAAADGWSGRLIAADIGAAYLARLGGATPAPVPGYPDYVRWERGQLASWAAADLPFWRAALAEPGMPVLGPDDRTSEAERIEHTVPLAPACTAGLLRRDRRERLVMLLHCAARALAQQNGTAAVVRLGTITSGRSDPRFRHTVGCFVNPVTVPVESVAGPPPAALSARVRQCLAHARTPFDEVIRDAGGGP
jgi:Condensation domain